MGPEKKSVYRPSAPAVEQAARLLLCLGKNQESHMGLSAICREIGIHKSKGFSILNALCQYDIVTKDPQSKAYSLGPALMPLAQKAKEKFDINTISRQPLKKLAKKTNASVLLGIITNDQFFVSSKYDGNDSLSVTIRLHQSLHITHGAHGKALFAHMDKEEQQRILDSDPILFHGETADLDLKELDREVEFCLENGYAVDKGKRTPGINAISAPIFDHNHTLAAAIVVAGPFGHEKFQEFGRQTARAAQYISNLSGDLRQP